MKEVEPWPEVIDDPAGDAARAAQVEAARLLAERTRLLDTIDSLGAEVRRWRVVTRAALAVLIIVAGLLLKTWL